MAAFLARPLDTKVLPILPHSFASVRIRLVSLAFCVTAQPTSRLAQSRHGASFMAITCPRRFLPFRFRRLAQPASLMLPICKVVVVQIDFVSINE